jgi:hypothetical protein
MRKVKIFCDGGLGNRLNSLIGGLITSELLNSNPIIYWPTNNWCGCEFSDLYDTDIPIINEGLNNLFKDNLNNIFLIHENQTKFDLKKSYPQNLNSISNILNLEEDVIYYNSLLAPYCSLEKTIEKLSSLKIKSELILKVKNFINKHLIDKDTVGIHFRKTDYQNDPSIITNESQIKNLIIKNEKLNFYISSDSNELETEFLKFKNVFIYPKTSNVLKNIDGGWNDKMIDDQGRETPFNVNRPKQSVIEAFTSLLILSKTQIPFNSRSTFLQYAKLYANIEI